MVFCCCWINLDKIEVLMLGIGIKELIWNMINVFKINNNFDLSLLVFFCVLFWYFGCFVIYYFLIELLVVLIVVLVFLVIFKFLILIVFLILFVKIIFVDKIFLVIMLVVFNVFKVIILLFIFVKLFKWILVMWNDFNEVKLNFGKWWYKGIWLFLKLWWILLFVWDFWFLWLWLLVLFKLELILWFKCLVLCLVFLVGERVFKCILLFFYFNYIVNLIDYIVYCWSIFKFYGVMNMMKI